MKAAGNPYPPLLLLLDLLAITLLLGGAAAAVGNDPARVPPGAKAMTRQGDALISRLILYPAELKKTTPSGLVESTVVFEPATLDGPKVLRQHGTKEKDRIAALPGQPGGVNFNQYGGHVTVDDKAGRALFYYFAEAPNAASKPLLLWLNGGPGCSSIGYGALQELGPFRVMSDGKTLFSNPYAWNRVANVLFLESPAGVGFSYSNTSSDYKANGDARSAEDAYVFLVNWLERFPEYKTRDFYIAGESYAGHYVPQLAHTILRYNLQSPDTTIINLKGIAIGNALMNDPTDSKGRYDFFWTHALISDETHAAIEKNCDFTYKEETQNEECRISLNPALGIAAQVEIYNIYGPLCFDANITAVPKRASIKHFDPCTNYYVTAYMNNPEVQEALHANATKLDGPWFICSDLPAWVDTTDTILPLLKELMEKGLRVWVYSGDNDGGVPVTSSRYSVTALGLPLKTPWQPWIAAGEVAGYSEVYKGDVTLATVRGAGHQVPSFQALRSLVLITAFLEGKPLPLYPSQNYQK